MGAFSPHYNIGGLSSEGFAKVMWVGSSSLYQTGTDGRNPNKPLATLTEALHTDKLDSTDRGTLIVVRRGYALSVSAADFFSLTGSKKRVTIRGEGDETDRPTLTWSAAGSTWLIDTASVVVENMNLNLDAGAGTVNTAAAITITGQGSGFRRCKIRSGTDANAKVTLGIVVSSAADCFMEDVYWYGATAAEATTHLRLTAATRFRMKNVTIEAATSAAAVGVIQFLTTASTGVLIEDCAFRNNKALSSQAVTGMAAVGGIVRNTHFTILDDATLAAWGTPADVTFDSRCCVTNLAGETAAVKTTVST